MELKKPEISRLEEIALITKLAKFFNVSVPAMTFRLENMNVLLYK